jgi:hypothetical protein
MLLRAVAGQPRVLHHTADIAQGTPPTAPATRAVVSSLRPLSDASQDGLARCQRRASRPPRQWHFYRGVDQLLASVRLILRGGGHLDICGSYQPLLQHRYRLLVAVIVRAEHCSTDMLPMARQPDNVETVRWCHAVVAQNRVGGLTDWTMDGGGSPFLRLPMR